MEKSNNNAFVEQQEKIIKDSYNRDCRQQAITIAERLQPTNYANQLGGTGKSVAAVISDAEKFMNG